MELEGLITAVKKRPAIYDKEHDSYCNRQLLKLMWRQIAEETGYDVQTARKRWTALRDYFQKQMKPTRALKLGKSKKWYLYDAMSFLSPHISERTPSGPLYSSYGDDDIVVTKTDNEADEDNDDTMSYLSTSSLSPTSLPRVTIVGTAPQEPSLVGTAPQTPSLVVGNTPPAPSFLDVTPAGGENHQISRKRKRDQEYPPQGNGAPPLYHLQVMSALQELRDAKPELDEDELFFRSLIPKMKHLDPISKMECQSEVLATILGYVKRSVSSCSQQQQPVETKCEPVDD